MCCNQQSGVCVCVQVLADAATVDAKAARNESITPLCGLPLAVKDSIDVLGYPTTASTPALLSTHSLRSNDCNHMYRACKSPGHSLVSCAHMVQTAILL